MDRKLETIETLDELGQQTLGKWPDSAACAATWSWYIRNWVDKWRMRIVVIFNQARRAFGILMQSRAMEWKEQEQPNYCRATVGRYGT